MTVKSSNTESTRKNINVNGQLSFFARVDSQVVGLLIAFLLVVAIIGFQVPGAFFTTVNMLNISQGITLVGITALAQMVVMIMGGLDISIGSMVGLCSAAAGMVMLDAENTVIGAMTGILVALFAGSMGGVINGLLVTKGKIDPIIVTLGTYLSYRGVALLITGNGYAVNVRNDAFNSIGTSALLRIPTAVVILLISIGVFYFVLTKTTYGRRIYAIGGNPVASRLAGIQINRYQLSVYILCGLMAAVAAITYTARTKSGQPISGSEDLALQAITAAILGGVSLKGGKGNIFGVVLAVLIIGTLNNGMILLSIPTFYQRVARGLLLIIAVIIQNLQFLARKGKN